MKNIITISILWSIFWLVCLAYLLGVCHYEREAIEKAYQPLLSMPIPQCGERESNLDDVVWEWRSTDLGQAKGIEITEIDYCKEPRCEPCKPKIIEDCIIIKGLYP
jgi:hypothetical protein